MTAREDRVTVTGSDNDRTDRYMTPEAELVLQLCRPRPADAQLERAEHLLKGDLDWGRIVDHAVRHRVLPAVWTHTIRMAADRIDQMHDHLARAVMLYNAERADATRREFAALRAVFTERGLPFLPRKGIYLAWHVYPDPSWRYMSDIDLIVRRADSGRLKEAMKELGYIQGNVVGDGRRVEPLARRVEAFWMVHTSSLPAFRRPVGGPASRFFDVDLRHHILEPAAGKTFDIDEWFDRGREEWLLGGVTRIMSRADFFLDLCVHLYREAVTLTSIEQAKDLLLTRFVDVAEVLASPHAAPDYATLVDSARRYDLSREVYFVLRHTENLLAASVDATLLEALAPADDVYLDEYGTLDGQADTWRDPIRTRIFDYRRREWVRARSRLLR
jgi:hypothetical protein